MGIVVPPSIAFIVFAVVAAEYQKVSISRLFIAGVVPGIMLAVAFFIAAVLLPRTRKNGRIALDTENSTPELTFANFGKAFTKALPGLMIPVIILGGIYGGVFTPTEAGAVASVYALLVGVLIYRDLKIREIPKLFLEAGISTASIMFIVGVASLFSYVITVEGVAQRISDAVLSVTDSRILILLLATIILLIVGAFIDAISAFYLFVPILVPTLIAVGVDITTIGVFMTVNLAIGLFTPPVGLNLYVAAGIGKEKLENLVKGILPFLLAAFVTLLLITYFPVFSNWLPDLFGVK